MKANGRRLAKLRANADRHTCQAPLSGRWRQRHRGDVLPEGAGLARPHPAPAGREAGPRGHWPPGVAEPASLPKSPLGRRPWGSLCSGRGLGCDPGKPAVGSTSNTRLWLCDSPELSTPRPVTRLTPQVSADRGGAAGGGRQAPSMLSPGAVAALGERVPRRPSRELPLGRNPESAGKLAGQAACRERGPSAPERWPQAEPLRPPESRLGGRGQLGHRQAA